MRPAWVIVAFGAGIVVGVGAARLGTEDVPSPGRAVPATAAAPDPLPTSPDAPALPAMRASVAPPAPAARVAQQAPSVPDSPVAMTDAPVPEADADYAGYSQPVDAGPVFQKIIGQKPVPGVENRVGEMHRALEREVRDDSWAYPMEAEIQNSLMAETSAGKLAIEHLECRATLCELRLSGNTANEQALSDWTSGLNKQPFAQRLFMNLSSSVSDGQRVDSLLIFRKPQRAGTAN